MEGPLEMLGPHGQSRGSCREVLGTHEGHACSASEVFPLLKAAVTWISLSRPPSPFRPHPSSWRLEQGLPPKLLFLLLFQLSVHLGLSPWLPFSH